MTAKAPTATFDDALPTHFHLFCTCQSLIVEFEVGHYKIIAEVGSCTIQQIDFEVVLPIVNAVSGEQFSEFSEECGLTDVDITRLGHAEGCKVFLPAKLWGQLGQTIQLHQVIVRIRIAELDICEGFVASIT